MVPLHEITSISEMMDADKIRGSIDFDDLNNADSFSGSSNSITTRNLLHADESYQDPQGNAKFVENELEKSCIQIRTLPDGFNSGRTYYLQTNSEIHRSCVVNDILKAVDEAKTRYAATSFFRSSQLRILRVYDTMQFQVLVALLIMTVSLLPHTPQS